jgi:putative sterol carrier protein
MAESVASFFNTLEEHIDRSKTEGMDATFQFNISGDGGGQWYVVLEDGEPSVKDGTAENPNIVFNATAPDWLEIVTGKMSGQSAFLMGKLRLQGDMTLAMKLQDFLV